MSLQLKRSNVAGKVPVVADLDDGQLAVNTRDAILFMKKTVTGVDSVVRVGAEMSPLLAGALKETTGAAFMAALGAGSADFDLISTTAAAGAEVLLTGLGIYRDIMLVGIGVQGASSMTTQMQVGSSGGYLSTSIYQHPSATVTQFALSDSGLSARSFSLTIRNFNRTDAIKPCIAGTQVNTYTNWPVAILTSTALDRIRVFPSTGNFSAGNLYIFGRRG